MTLDTDGALVVERDRAPYRTYARAEHHSRAAGAGDTFLATLALALAAGADTPAAAELASAAAAVVVGHDGTVACSTGELLARVAPGTKPTADLRPWPPGSPASAAGGAGSSSPTAASTSCTGGTSPT